MSFRRIGLIAISLWFVRARRSGNLIFVPGALPFASSNSVQIPPENLPLGQKQAAARRLQSSGRSAARLLDLSAAWFRPPRSNANQNFLA